MDGDPLTRALAHKNKGNKYFRGGRYELAIKSYTEAILVCPKEKATDLSTFYQNRAAAHEKLVSFVELADWTKLRMVIDDIGEHAPGVV